MSAIAWSFLVLLLVAASLAAASVVMRRRFLDRLGNIQQRIATHVAVAPAREDLPQAVADLATRLGVTGRPASVVRYRERGLTQRHRGGTESPFAAEIVLAADDPRFASSIRLRPWLALAVAFSRGDGLTEGRWYGPFARWGNRNTAPGRREGRRQYLTMLPWCPDAILLNRALHWTVEGSETLRVSIGEGPERTEVTFTLDAAGLIDRVDVPLLDLADGESPAGGGWSGRCWDYRHFGGRLVPTRHEAEHGSGRPGRWHGELIDWVRQ